MLIILEGPDGVGKSTLAGFIASKIADQGGRPQMWHKGPPTQHPLDEYITPLLDYRPHSGIDIICDRWHWGEVVYPAFLRRETKMNPGVFEYVELFLQSRATLVVYLTRDHAALRQTLIERGDGVVHPHYVDVLIAQYDGISTRSKIHSIHINVNHVFSITDVDDAAGAWEKLALQIIYAASAIEDSHNNELRDLVTYVGAPHPKTLILGDVRHRAELQHTLAPAFGPYSATSGHYLMNVLEAEFHGPTYGVANACDVDNIELMMQILQPTRVVALGNNAHERLEDVSIPHGAAPHPQFIRRFYHDHMREYQSIIARVAYSGEDLRSWRPS